MSSRNNSNLATLAKVAHKAANDRNADFVERLRNAAAKAATAQKAAAEASKDLAARFIESYKMYKAEHERAKKDPHSKSGGARRTKRAKGNKRKQTRRR